MKTFTLGLFIVVGLLFLYYNITVPKEIEEIQPVAVMDTTPVKVSIYETEQIKVDTLVSYFTIGSIESDCIFVEQGSAPMYLPIKVPKKYLKYLDEGQKIRVTYVDRGNNFQALSIYIVNIDYQKLF